MLVLRHLPDAHSYKHKDGRTYTGEFGPYAPLKVGKAMFLNDEPCNLNNEPCKVVTVDRSVQPPRYVVQMDDRNDEKKSDLRKVERSQLSETIGQEDEKTYEPNGHGVMTYRCPTCKGTGQVPGRFFGKNRCKVCQGTGNGAVYKGVWANGHFQGRRLAELSAAPRVKTNWSFVIITVFGLIQAALALAMIIGVYKVLEQDAGKSLW